MRVNVTPQQIHQAFVAVKDDPSFAESRALHDAGHRPAEMIQALCLRPELLRAFAGFGESVYPGGLLERRLKELVILESSRANACQFCTQSHISLTRMLGLLDDPLAEIDDADHRSQRETLAIEYTRAAMLDSNRVPDELFARLRAHFTDAEIVELTFLIGFINMLNLFNNCLQVAYHGEYERVSGSA